MQFSLRSLMILTAVGPPAFAAGYYFFKELGPIEVQIDVMFVMGSVVLLFCLVLFLRPMR